MTDPKVLVQLLGLTYNSPFFRERALTGAENVLRVFVGNDKVGDTRSLRGIDRVAYDMLRQKRWVRGIQRGSTLYIVTHRGAQALRDIDRAREAGRRSLERAVEGLIDNWTIPNMPTPGLEDKRRLIDAVCQEAIMVESSRLEGASASGLARTRGLLLDLFEPGIVEWARAFYESLQLIQGGQSLVEHAQALKDFGKQVCLAHGILEWHEQFSRTGGVHLFLDADIIVAALSRGDAWHPLVTALLDRLLREGADVHEHEVAMQFLLAESSLNVFLHAARLAWQDFRSLAASQLDDLGRSGVRRLGLIHYFAAFGVLDELTAFDQVGEDLDALLTKLNVVCVSDESVSARDLTQLQSVAKDRSNAAKGFSPRSLRHRLRLRRTVQKYATGIPETEWALVLSTSYPFRRFDRELAAYEHDQAGNWPRPLVVPGLWMFCFAETVGVREDIISDFRELFLLASEGTAGGSGAIADIRRRWDRLSTDWSAGIPLRLALSGDAELVGATLRALDENLSMSSREEEEGNE